MNGTATFGRKQRAGGRLRRSMTVHQWVCRHHNHAPVRRSARMPSARAVAHAAANALAENASELAVRRDASVSATTNEFGAVITAQEFWNHSSVCSASVWNCLKTGFFLLLPGVVFNIDGSAHRGAFPQS
jgi:hypothetical protein